MASKPIEINETSFYQEVTQASKDATFVFKTNQKTYVKFNPLAVGDIRPTSYYVKDGNDLKFVTVFIDNKTKDVKKRVTMTILDFDSHNDRYSDVVQNSSSVVSKFYELKNGEIRVGASALVAGSDKADKYNFSAGGAYSMDFKGNDLYNIASWANPNTISMITDYSGNDKYNVSVLPGTTVESTTYGGKTRVIISDYAGNDTYNLKDMITVSGSSVGINDYNGNDKYNANGISDLVVYESNIGKDTYNITNTAQAKLYDWGGNDTYNVTNSKVEINENKSSGSSASVEGTSGNETYNLNFLSADSRVIDLLGNDKFNISYAQGTSANEISVIDARGKDTYKVTGSKYVEFTDMGGNDSYTLVDSDSLTLEDYVSGEDTGDKDSYTLKTVSNSEITDSTGNDTYNIESSLSTKFIDEIGTDKYTIASSSNIKISDNTNETSGTPLSGGNDGNDTFIVKDSFNTLLQSSSGNDKFTVSEDSVRTTILDNMGDEIYAVTDATLLKITDKAGNDSYKLTNVDNYSTAVVSTDTGSGALDYNIKDSDGSDKYDITKSRYVYLYDDSTTVKQANTFNIASSESVKVYSDRNSTVYSADTYNLSSNTTVSVEDRGDSADTYNLTSNSIVTITEAAGNDIYKINKSLQNSLIVINDEAGSDTYTLDKLSGKMMLTDKAGNDDTLIIKGGKADDIIFMSNAETDRGALYAYDKKSGGVVTINNYYDFTDEESGHYGGDHEYHLSGYGIGRIETVKVGSKAANIYTANEMDAFQQTVTAFLTSGGGSDYGSITAVLNSGDNSAIEGLIACFNVSSAG